MKKNTKREIVKSLRLLLWGGLFLLGISIVLGAMKRKENAAVEGVVIEIEPLTDGNFLLDSTYVRRILDHRFALPIDTFAVGQLDIERTERVLLDDPFIKTAQAFVDAQDRIHLELSQREPLLRVKDNNGLDYYLDVEGIQMPPSELYTAHVRVATGNIPPYEEGVINSEEHLLGDIFNLNQLLRADPFLDALVEQIYITGRGEIVLSPKVGRQIIYFGRFAKAEDKLQRLKTFYREGLPYKGWQAYKSFDLRYDGQVVCKKR